MNSLKELWHKWYFAVIFSTAALLIVVNPVGLRPSVLYSVIGVLISVVFLTQRQKLDELKAFREIFADCNKQYESLESALLCIVGKGETLTSEDKTTLFKYFNLCAEEYLYYKRGLVPDEVWSSWQAGVGVYFKNPAIRQLWEDDSKSDSYYGYTPPKP